MNKKLNRERNAKIAEKQARMVAEAMATPTAEKVVDMASRLGRSELLEAFEKVADKIGPVDALKHLYASLTDAHKQSPEVPKTLPGATEASPPVSLAPAKKVWPNTPESRLATVYAKPNNVRQRLIEFKDDGTHGTLWVQFDSPVWPGWVIWAKRNPDTLRGGWVLDGTYSWRGIRLS